MAQFPVYSLFSVVLTAQTWGLLSRGLASIKPAPFLPWLPVVRTSSLASGAHGACGQIASAFLFSHVGVVWQSPPHAETPRSIPSPRSVAARQPKGLVPTPTYRGVVRVGRGSAGRLASHLSTPLIEPSLLPVYAAVSVRAPRGSVAIPQTLRAAAFSASSRLQTDVDRAVFYSHAPSGH